jgi:RimJ/RimL family protein N-acetyltransferase
MVDPEAGPSDSRGDAVTLELSADGRIKLRPLVLNDALTLLRYRSDPAVRRFQSWEPETLDMVLEFIQALAREPNLPGTWFQFGIIHRATGELIGDCGIHFPRDEDHQAEIGITLAPAHQGQGFAAETLALVFDYLFGELGKHRVYGSVDPANTASLHLLERVGMRKEAHFLESLWFKGHWADDVVYGLLSREWSERRQFGKPRSQQ